MRLLLSLARPLCAAASLTTGGLLACTAIHDPTGEFCWLFCAAPQMSAVCCISRDIPQRKRASSVIRCYMYPAAGPMSSAPASPGFFAQAACRKAPHSGADQQLWGTGMFASSPLEVSTEEVSRKAAAPVAAASMLCCITCLQRQMECKAVAAADAVQESSCFKISVPTRPAICRLMIWRGR